MLFLNGLLYGGLWAGGLRHPAVWTAAAVLLWAAAFWRPPNLKTLPYPRLWTFWLAWAALSALFSEEPIRSLAAFSHPLTALLFFVMICASWRAIGHRFWFWLLCASGVGLGAAALWMKIPGYPFTGLLYPYYNYTVCVEAMAFSACLGALGAGYPKKTKEKAVLIGVMAFCLLEILLVKSRGGLAACGIAGALWMWRRGWRRLIVWSCVAALAVVVLMPSSWEASWLKMDKPGAYVRPNIWASAVAIADDHPLFGIGPGLFERGFLLHNFPAPEGSLPTRYGMLSAHAHSEFLQTAAETGWPGLALFLCALGFVFFRIWRRRELNWTQEAALSAFHAVLVQTFFDNILNLPALQWLYFSCLAVAWGEIATEPSLRRSMVWTRVACAGGLVLAALAWIPNYAVHRYQDLAYQSRGEESVRWMHCALRLAPADSGLWEDLARVYMRHSPPEFGPALNALSEASRRNPTSAIYPAMRGEILSSQGRWKEVQVYSRQALALEPRFAEARLLRAQALCRLGYRDGARRELEIMKSMQGLETDPSKSHGYTGMILFFNSAKYREISKSVREGCPGRE